MCHMQGKMHAILPIKCIDCAKHKTKRKAEGQSHDNKKGPLTSKLMSQQQQKAVESSQRVNQSIYLFKLQQAISNNTSSNTLNNLQYFNLVFMSIFFLFRSWAEIYGELKNSNSQTRACLRTFQKTFHDNSGLSQLILTCYAA